MNDIVPKKCPRCGSDSVEITTMGGPLTGERYNDTDYATCMQCDHKGKAGDWQRIEDLKVRLEGVTL